MKHTARHDQLDDAGVTLVELIVYVVLAAIFLAITASIFANGLSSQAQTTSRDTATGRAAVISNSLQTSVRNASAIKLETGGKTLRAKVATGATGFECRGWSLTAAGELRYKTSSSAIDISSTTGWTVLSTGVEGTLSGSVPFSVSGTNQLNYGLKITRDAQTVPITGGVTAQSKIEGAATCW